MKVRRAIMADSTRTLGVQLQNRGSTSDRRQTVEEGADAARDV